jgi:Spy/CpxP family protein refolding chaperone
MKKYILFFLIGAFLLNFQLLFAQPEDNDGPPFRDRVGKMLNLSDEQKSKIEDLRLNFEKEKLPLQSKIRELKTNLKLELTKDNYDEKKVDQTLDQIEALRKEMYKKRISHMRGVRNLLTDEQKKKFDMHVLSDQKFRDGPPMHHMQRPGKMMHQKQF